MAERIRISTGKIELVPPGFVHKIKDFQSTYKTATEKDIADYAENIKINGFLRPLQLWDRGELGVYCISGNQMIKAIKLLITQNALIPQIPIEYLSIQDETQAWQIILANDSVYGKVNKDFTADKLPVEKKYIQIMRCCSSRPIKITHKAKQIKKYPFKKGDTLKLGELQLILTDIDFSKPGRMIIDSLSMADRIITKYVDDCKYKNQNPEITLNNIPMRIM